MARVQKVIQLILSVPENGLFFAITIPWASQLRTVVILEIVRGMRRNFVDDDKDFDHRLGMLELMLVALLQKGAETLEIDDVYQIHSPRVGIVVLCTCPSFLYCEAEITYV